MKLSKILSTSVALAALTLSSASTAAFITGSIDITGDADVIDNLGSFGGIDFGDLDAGTAGDQASAILGTGDLAGLTPSNFGNSINVFDFTTANVPGAVLWSAGGFTFTLNALTVNSYNFTGFTNLTGKGILSNASFDDTDYKWAWSNQAGFSFSSSTSAVPEPSIVALLGLGLVGMGIATRRKQKAA